MVRTQVANEQTPLTDATRQKPSLELAMTRSRLRLLRSPEGTPWSLWGITAPFASFALLGAGPAAQVRIAGECVYLFAFLCAFGFPLYVWNYRPEHSLEANTAAGWGDLRWGQALLDFAISTTFILFIMYNQFRLLDGSVYKTVQDRLRLPDVPDGLRVRQVVSNVKEAVERTLPDRGSTFMPTSKISHEYADELHKIDDVGLMLHDSHLVEACSIVLSGWGRGKRLPTSALSDLTTVTGARPVMAVQAARCLDLEIACEKLESIHTQLTDARDRAQPTAASVAKLTAAHAEAAARVEQLRVRGEGAGGAPLEDDLLDFAFITFGTSEQRARAVEQAHVLRWRLGRRGSDNETDGVTVMGAPNPGDVAWRNLEATRRQRFCSNAFHLLVMLPAAVFVGVMFSFFCVLTPLLHAGPLEFDPWSTYPRRFGYFLAIVTIYGLLLQILLQPLFQSFIGNGLCGQPALRITCNSYTAMHAKVGSYWLLVELIILSAIFGFYCLFTIGDEDDTNGTFKGKEFAYAMTRYFGLPKEDVNFYSMWGTECQMNILMAAFAECFAASWLLPALPQYLFAPWMRTQSAMDEWVRIRNPAVLPFTVSDTTRILAVSMWWSGIFPVQIPCALIYYLMAVFVARSNLLGRVEPGPPTKPLQYRLVFGVYLPLHMLLRFLVTALIYMDVPLPNPNEQPFGNLSLEHWSVTPQTTFHSVYAIFGAVALLVLIPLAVRRHALRTGVLTPWQLLCLWLAPYCFSLALEDLDFGVASRVQAGNEFVVLDETSSSSELGSSFVLLPEVDKLPRGARFRAPNGLDLLAAEK